MIQYNSVTCYDNIQMGSNMKPTIFNERVVKALHSWHQNARKQIKKNHHSGSVTPASSRPTTPVHSSSPVHLLRYYNNELDSGPVSPGTPNYRIEKWQAEQDEISWSQRGTTAGEQVEEEMETRDRTHPIISQTNDFHHEINVMDFSFDRTSAV